MALSMSVSRAVARQFHRAVKTNPRIVPMARAYHATALQQGGMSPPIPPFARSPRRTEPMTENSDALWDDGVAPELALDFDCPNVSTSDALRTFVSTFSGFGVLMLGIYIVTGGAKDMNPAYSHATDCVDVDYSRHDVVPVETPEGA